MVQSTSRAPQASNTEDAATINLFAPWPGRFSSIASIAKSRGSEAFNLSVNRRGHGVKHSALQIRGVRLRTGRD